MFALLARFLLARLFTFDFRCTHREIPRSLCTLTGVSKHMAKFAEVAGIGSIPRASLIRTEDSRNPKYTTLQIILKELVKQLILEFC
jgi:hypothetical protein